MTSKHVLLGVAVVFSTAASCKEDFKRSESLPTAISIGKGSSLRQLEPIEPECQRCAESLKESATLIASDGTCEVGLDLTRSVWKLNGAAVGPTDGCFVRPKVSISACTGTADRDRELAAGGVCACRCQAALQALGTVFVSLRAESGELLGATFKLP